MLQVGPYIYKRAETRQEFEQIHRLNYQTFVNEIPQHPDHGQGFLVDKFHHKNQYIIGLRDGRVIGMISVHDQTPFSVADRLPDPGLLQSPGCRPIEVRLLAIEPEERTTNFFFGLVWKVYEQARKDGYTDLFISAVMDKLHIYEQLGFEALGPARRCGSASFVPMVLKVGHLSARVERMRQQWEKRLGKLLVRSAETICLLPGPVTISQAVKAAFHERPIYHRGSEFISRFVALRGILGDMVGGKRVAILNGSGTLANETIAATLAATPSPGPGIMLSNGEFGERLVRQALRFGHKPQILRWDWGEPWDLSAIEEVLAKEPAGSWIWGVHQESSTGVLNDLRGLVKRAARHGIRVYADCISSLGAVPIDLSGVSLASGTSGKSLGAIAGAALVFAEENALDQVDCSRLPSYFDLRAALDSDGPCYTFPSPTLRALETALEEYATPERAVSAHGRFAELGRYVRQQLRRLGLQPLARDADASPVITSFAPPGVESALSFVTRCRGWGYAIGGQSAYLAERRLVQIATMGAVTREMLEPLFANLEKWLAQQAEPALVC